jgi:hypothetical protein
VCCRVFGELKKLAQRLSFVPRGHDQRCIWDLALLEVFEVGEIDRIIP